MQPYAGDLLGSVNSPTSDALVSELNGYLSIVSRALPDGTLSLPPDLYPCVKDWFPLAPSNLPSTRSPTSVALELDPNAYF